MRRHFATLRTRRFFPLVTAFRADSASVECIPMIPTLTGPKVRRAWRPLTPGATNTQHNRAEYFVEFGRRTDSAALRFRRVCHNTAVHLREAFYSGAQLDLCKQNKGPGREFGPDISPLRAPGC